MEVEVEVKVEEEEEMEGMAFDGVAEFGVRKSSCS